MDAQALGKIECLSKVSWHCERLRASVPVWLRKLGKVSSRKWDSHRSLKVSSWGGDDKKSQAQKGLDNSWIVLLQEVTGGKEGWSSCVPRGQLAEHMSSLGRTLWSSQVSNISSEFEEESLQKLSVGKERLRSFPGQTSKWPSAGELGETAKSCLGRRGRWEDMVSFSQTLGNL